MADDARIWLDFLLVRQARADYCVKYLQKL